MLCASAFHMLEFKSSFALSLQASYWLKNDSQSNGCAWLHQSDDALCNNDHLQLLPLM